MSALQPGDQVYLIGPGFLQLVIAKVAKSAGLKPIIVAPQKKLDSFVNFLRDDELIRNDGTIGMPETFDKGFGEIAGVVFCSETPDILPTTMISRVLDYKDQGRSAFVEGGLKRVICCAPVSNKVQKEKNAGWIPIMSFMTNDEKEQKYWDSFIETFWNHPTGRSEVASVVRFGSLFGGSIDGPESLQEFGLDENIYKMSLEQFRDVRERGFDRFKLGCQILEGNRINPCPPNQEKMEREYLKDNDVREGFKVVGGYPEVDRTNRHVVAQAVVKALMRSPRAVGTKTDDSSVPREMTVLSKSAKDLPTPEEWDEMFANPGPAAWPDPAAFDPAEFGLGKSVSK